MNKKLFSLRRKALMKINKGANLLADGINKGTDFIMAIEKPKGKESMPQMRATKRDNHLSLWLSKEEVEVFEDIKLLIRNNEEINKGTNSKFSEIIYRALKLGDFYHNE